MAGDASVRDILVVGLSCVGDAVMTTPVLQSLHQHYPDAHIDLVSDRRSNQIFQYCPYVRDIFLKDKSRFLRGSWDVIVQARQRKYDLVVDLRTAFMAYFCRTRHRLTRLGDRAYGPHAVEQLMGVIRPTHGDRPIPAAKIWLSEKEHEKARSLLSGLPPGKWLAMSPGNPNPNKRWKPEYHAGLANALASLISGVILDGGPAEREDADAVAKLLDVPCVNVAGQTSILDAAAILQRASLFVGSDSGPGHMAAAMGTPTLTLFSVDRPERVLPWPCNGKFVQSPDDQTASIPLADVLALAKDIL